MSALTREELVELAGRYGMLLPNGVSIASCERLSPLLAAIKANDE